MCGQGIGFPAEAAVVDGLNVIPIQNPQRSRPILRRRNQACPTKVNIEKLFEHLAKDENDFSEVKGQKNVNRALEIAGDGQNFS